jgi:hypothetical protein
VYNITINDNIKTLGLITFQISKDENDNLITEGLLKTHLYIEEINTLECKRFRLEGIDVYAEAFGSTDIFNLYKFTYQRFEIKETGGDLSEEDLIQLYDKELN